MDTKQLLPEKITLPSGGMVHFRDLESLTGKDVREFRLAFNEEGRGNLANRTSELLAKLLITRWEIPNRPQLPLPSEDPTILDLLTWRDLLALEDAMSPVVGELRSDGKPTTSDGTPDTSPGSPTPPDSE